MKYTIYEEATGRILGSGYNPSARAIQAMEQLQPAGVKIGLKVAGNADLHKLERIDGILTLVDLSPAERAEREARKPKPMQTVTVDSVIAALKTVGLEVPRSAFRTPAPGGSAGNGSPS